MAYPEPSNVAPWYLRNINQALALDSVTGNVYLRTGFTGNIVIEGNVNIPGNVDAHIVEFGNIDISGNTLPISGTVAVSTVTGNVTVVQGTNPWSVTGNVSIIGNVNASVTGNVNASVTGNVNASVTGNVNASVTGNVNASVTGNVNASVTGNVNASVIGNVNVTQGTSPWSVTGNINANVTGGNITTTLNPAAITAFDEPLAITITPVIQADGIYGLNPDTWSQTNLNGGNITTTSTSTWQVQSGTTAGGYARLATSRYMTYQPGQGSMFRWTVAFTTTGGITKDAFGVDNIVQTSGPIDREDGYAIGYSGSTVDNASRKIGFLHRRNGAAETQQLTVTTAPTGAQTATVTLNGQAFIINLTASASVEYTATQIAALLKANTVANNTWDIIASGNVVTFSYYSPGPRSGTYSFSSTGTGTIAVAAFTQLIAGVTPVDNWTYVDAWDNQNVNFDPTKLNLFAIDMRWLGAGIVRLFMENPATGQMELMHTQKWSSQYTVPHINKPSLRLIYRSGTTGNATPSQNVVVTGSSVMAGIQGLITQTTSSQSYFDINSTTRAKDIVWHLISIQNPITRNSNVNKSTLVIQDLTISSQGNDPSVIYLIKNCVGTSDYLVYNPIPAGTSFNFAQYSISDVTENLSADVIALVQTLGINSSTQFNLLDYGVNLSPGETISVFASSSGALTRTSVGITWKVD